MKAQVKPVLTSGLQDIGRHHQGEHLQTLDMLNVDMYQLQYPGAASSVQ
jgi:hypothetical protein